MSYSLSSTIKEIINDFKAYEKQMKNNKDSTRTSSIPNGYTSKVKNPTNNKKGEEVDDDICQKNGIAIYVNLFRVQLINGVSRNVAFFYNTDI